MDQIKSPKSFKKVEWTFKSIVDIAKDIKPSGWIVVATRSKLSFMELSLGQQGPALIEKQLVLDHQLESEAYLGPDKVADGLFPFKLHNIQSSGELYVCLKLFASYGLCQGNKNFKRINKNGEVSVTDYWKNTNCHKVFDKSLRRPEHCCDACLQLNHILPKKINNVYLSLNQPALFKSVKSCYTQKGARQRSGKRKKPDPEQALKRPKEEREDALFSTEFVIVKEEPLSDH
ncbi:hypothetical protein YQE_08413, partial [Dendroctonus ponderosae]